MFITHATFTGTLANGGGLSGADKTCAAAAQAASLGGAWRAWASTTTVNAIDRIVDVGPWFDLQGTKIFANKDGLKTSPLAGLWLDEHGAGLASDDIWTGTNYGGVFSNIPTEMACSDWTSASMSDGAKIGQVGWALLRGPHLLRRAAISKRTSFAWSNELMRQPESKRTIDSRWAAIVAVAGLAGLVSCSHDKGEATAPEAPSPASAPALAPSTAISVTSTGPTASAAPVPSTTVAAPVPAGDLKIVPMRMAFDAKGCALELRQDGTVWAEGIVVMGTAPGDYVATASGKAAQIGSLSKNALTLIDKNRPGVSTIAVWNDGTLTNSDSRKKATFDEQGNLVLEGGAKLAIDDKGKLDVMNDDGTKAMKSAPIIVGYKPEVKRTAVVLAILYVEMQSHGVVPLQ